MAYCCRILIGCALLATPVTTLAVYPHQLAYFNEAAGGPVNGERQLAGSSLDWAQSILQLKEWSDNHAEFRPLLVVLNPTYNVHDLGLANSVRVASDGTIRSPRVFAGNCATQTAWVALSRNYVYRTTLSPLQVDDHRITSQLDFRALADRPVKYRVGYAINIYTIRCSEGLLVPVEYAARNRPPR